LAYADERRLVERAGELLSTGEDGPAPIPADGAERA